MMLTRLQWVISSNAIKRQLSLLPCGVSHCDAHTLCWEYNCLNPFLILGYVLNSSQKL